MFQPSSNTSMTGRRDSTKKSSILMMRSILKITHTEIRHKAFVKSHRYRVLVLKVKKLPILRFSLAALAALADHILSRSNSWLSQLRRRRTCPPKRKKLEILNCSSNGKSVQRFPSIGSCTKSFMGAKPIELMNNTRCTP